MENTISMAPKALPSGTRTADFPEESGWTSYFEDFLCDNNNMEDDQRSTGLSYGHGDRTSLVSDAASSTAKKIMANNDDAGSFFLDRSCRKLSFKKRKTKGQLVDDALEDTASSPVNSPKVCHLNQLEVNANLMREFSLEKGGTSGRTDEGNELNLIGRESDYSELKKRGLCLVPVSTLANFIS